MRAITNQEQIYPEQMLDSQLGLALDGGGEGGRCRGALLLPLTHQLGRAHSGQIGASTTF